MKAVLLCYYNKAIECYLNFKRIISSKHTQISIGDIMLVRKSPTHLQFAIAALLLDVENYCKGDKTLHYQNTIKKLVYGNDYNTDKDDLRFTSLIDSCINEGFKKNSKLFVDQEVRLFNGTHRTAMCLYLGITSIETRLLPFREDYIKDISFYTKIGAPKQYMDDVHEKFSAIQNWLIFNGHTFCCYIANGQSQELILRYIEKSVNMLRKIRVCLSDHSFAGLFFSNGGLLVQFSIEEPSYRYAHGGVESCYTLDLMQYVFDNYCTDKSVFWISHNCTEGKRMFDMLTPLLIIE